MLKLSGMTSRIITAGTATVKSLKSISKTLCIINTPTTTSAGAVANAGTAAISG